MKKNYEKPYIEMVCCLEYDVIANGTVSGEVEWGEEW